jgi:hypothetical protein
MLLSITINVILYEKVMIEKIRIYYFLPINLTEFADFKCKKVKISMTNNEYFYFSIIIKKYWK